MKKERESLILIFGSQKLGFEPGKIMKKGENEILKERDRNKNVYPVWSEPGIPIIQLQCSVIN